MDKIPFVDGTKTSNAKVTIEGQEYEVTPAQYTGTTPMSAFNLNKMQDNIEKAIPITNTIKVSATEPSPKADVWIQHGDDVEDDIFVNNNGVYNSVLTHDITTGVEYKTNKVIDGHQIYGKYMTLGALPNNTTKNYSTGVDCNKIVDFQSWAIGNDVINPLPYARSTNPIIAYFYQGNFTIVTTSDESSKTAKLYVEYYKD